MKKVSTKKSKTAAPTKARASKFTPGLYKVIPKRSNAGIGLFAVEDIPKKKCIIEYVGRVIKGEEEYTSNSKYLFEVHSRKTIDGRDRSNTARYINHSCRPNAEIEIRKGRVFVMALKNIKAGEEICYDYGKEYWNEHIKKHGCRCVKCKETKSAK